MSTSSSSKETGIKDGSSQILITDNEFNRLTWLNEFMWWSKKTQPIDLTKFHINLFDGIIQFELKKGAKLTDVLLHLPPILGGYVIAKKIRDIFLKYKLGNIQFKDVTIIDKNEQIISSEYCLMQVPFLEDESIDWKNTFFSDMKYDLTKVFIPSHTPDQYIAYYFNDHNEYKERGTIGLTCRYLSVNSNLDITKFSGSSDLLISSELKTELDEYKFSNMVFIPFDKNIKELKHISV